MKDSKSSGESRLIEDKNPNPQGPLKEISKIIQKHKKEKYGNEHKNRKYDSLENIKYSNTNENMIVSNGDTLEDIGSKSMIRTDSSIEDKVRKVRVSNEIQRSIPQSIEEDDAKNVKGNGAIPIKAFKRYNEIFIILNVPIPNTIYTFIESKDVRTKGAVRSAKELRIKDGALIVVMLKRLSRLA